MRWYHCENCGCEFMNPQIRYESENLDGEEGIENLEIPCCPECGSEEIGV